jgi:transcriptional regulator with XRE-family HTH domain
VVLTQFGRLRRRSGLSQRQVALVAGVPSAVVSRFEAGLAEPRLGTLQQLYQAIGYDFEVQSRPVADPAASVAARWLLGDGSTEGYQSSLWVGRLRRLCPGLQADKLCWLASRYDNMRRRRDAVSGQVGTVVTVLDRAAAYPGRWAATGSMVAEMVAPGVGVAWLTFYADSPEQFAQTVGMVEPAGPSAAVPPGTPWPTNTILIMPYTAAARLGATTIPGGIPIVAPLQAAIDLYGGTSRMPDQAGRVLQKLGYEEVQDA